MVRAMEDLRRDQLSLLAEHRAEQGPAPSVLATPRSPIGGSEVVYGRVFDILYFDPVNGPHVLVMRQIWSGTPPTPRDGGSALRGYPLPPRTVDSFNVGDLVRLCVVPGAVLIEPLP